MKEIAISQYEEVKKRADYLDIMGIKEYHNKRQLWMKKSLGFKHNEHRKVINLDFWRIDWAKLTLRKRK